MHTRLSATSVILALAATLAIGSMGAANAQEGNADDDQATYLEEIIVTASKREQSVQDVSVSITSITGDTMTRFGIRDFNDYINLVPGLSTSQRSAASELGPREVGLRGVQTISGAFLVGQNTVGFYIDETPVTMSNPRLVDLERIEVLRGPQGTLYGAASLAGAIKIVTRKPDFERFDGHVMASVSDTEFGGGNFDVEAMLNIPVSERLALRVSAYREENDGYIDIHEIDIFANPTGDLVKKDANGETVTGGRLALSLLATDSLTISASVMHDNTKQDATNYLHPRSPGDTGTLSVPGQLYRSFGIGAPYVAALDGDRNDYDDPIFLGRGLDNIYTKFTLSNLTFDWQINDSFRAVSNTSYYVDEMTMRLDVTEAFGLLVSDANGLPAPRYMPGDYSPENEEITHETRLQTTWDRKANFTAGVFYTNRREDYNTRFFAGENTTVSFPAFGLLLPNSPDGYIFWSTSYRDRDEFALFGEATYDFTDQWRAVVGMRAFWHEFALWDHFRGNPLFISGGDFVLEGGNKDDGVVPNFKLEYRPTDNALFYASAAEGFRMGGANFPLPDSPACRAELQARIGTPRTPERYLSDSLWTYELGWKQTFGDGRVTTALAWFYTDWQDTQVGVNPLCQLNGSVINLGSVESQGVEFEMSAAISEYLVLAMNLTYIDSQIGEDYIPEGSDPSLDPLAEKGGPMPDVPMWMGSVLADFSMPINPGTEFFVRGDYSYRSEQAGSAFATAGAAGTQNGYGELNARLGIAWKQWEFTLFGDNLTGELPSIEGVPGSFTLVGFRETDITIRPFTWGLSVRMNFSGEGR